MAKGEGNEEARDYLRNDMSKLSREDLYREVRLNQEIYVEVILKWEWIMGAFMSTLECDFHFGKKRMRKLLKGVQKRFNLYSQFSGGYLEFGRYLEEFGFRYFVKKGKVLLQDLRDPNYAGYLAPGLRELAGKIESGKLDRLTEEEQEALEILKKVMPLKK